MDTKPLEALYDAHNAKIKAENAEYKKAVEDFLKENGLGGDVYNKSGRRGRLRVEKTYGDYEIKFYAYTKKGELSMLSSGSVWLGLASGLNAYRSAEEATDE